VNRIPIKYARPYAWLLTAIGAPARWSDIRVDERRVRVRMSYAFRARFDRSNIAEIRAHRACVSVGAHGWRGRWLVNGAHRPIVSITLRAPARARVLGFPVQLTELRVSVEDVGALRDALLA
jgi:hypothetical protein